MKAWVMDRGKAYRGKRYRAVWIDPSTRKERSRSFDRKRDAEEHRTFIENSMRERPYGDPTASRKKFAEVSEAWMASRKKIRDSTRDRDTRDLRTWVFPMWGERSIGSITREEVIAWVDQLQRGTAPHCYAEKSAGKIPAGLSPRSIRGLYVAFKGTMNHAVSLGWLSHHNVGGIELPRGTEPNRIYLSFEEIEELASRAADITGETSQETLVRMLAFTGLRSGEAFALRVGDLDFDTRRIKVERTWTQSNGKPKLGPTKSGKSRRVPMHQFLTPEYESLVAGRGEAEWLFRAPRSGPISQNNWRARVWKLCLRDSKWEQTGLVPHQLRHTAASIAIAAGADVKVVQEMLGHASAVETLNTYADLWPDRLDEVSEKVDLMRSRGLKRRSSAGPQ